MTEYRVCPKAKTGKVGSDAGHLEGNCLQWGITPRLIIRRIDTQIIAQHHIIVCHVNNTIITVKITGQEYHLHLLVFPVMHVVVFHHAQHIVMAHIMEPVSNLGHIKRRIIFLSTLQAFLQILTRLAHPSRNFNKCNNLLLQVAIAKQTVHGFHKYIDTLIAELITARC